MPPGPWCGSARSEQDSGFLITGRATRPYTTVVIAPSPAAVASTIAVSLSRRCVIAITDGYCEPSAEKTSIGRTVVNVNSGI